MKKVIVLAVGATALLLGTSVHAADYPVAPRQAQSVRHAYVETRPTCFRGRFAYMRYAPVLATSYLMRPEFISEAAPCACLRSFSC